MLRSTNNATHPGDVVFTFTTEFVLPNGEKVDERGREIAWMAEVYIRGEVARLYDLAYGEALEELAEFERRYGAA